MITRERTTEEWAIEITKIHVGASGPVSSRSIRAYLLEQCPGCHTERDATRLCRMATDRLMDLGVISLYPDCDGMIAFV